MKLALALLAAVCLLPLALSNPGGSSEKRSAGASSEERDLPALKKLLSLLSHAEGDSSNGEGSDVARSTSEGETSSEEKAAKLRPIKDEMARIVLKRDSSDDEKLVELGKLALRSGNSAMASFDFKRKLHRPAKECRDHKIGCDFIILNSHPGYPECCRKECPLKLGRTKTTVQKACPHECACALKHHKRGMAAGSPAATPEINIDMTEEEQDMMNKMVDHLL